MFERYELGSIKWRGMVVVYLNVTIQDRIVVLRQDKAMKNGVKYPTKQHVNEKDGKI